MDISSALFNYGQIVDGGESALAGELEVSGDPRFTAGRAFSVTYIALVTQIT
jgi:hypothetical protein